MASRELSELAEVVMADMPPMYQGDRVMEAVQDAIMREIERVEAAAVAIRDGLGWPQLSSDDMRLLAMWETLLKLPVEPEDATVEQRLNTVVATLHGRLAKSGQSWEAAITKMLGGGWSWHEGPGDYEITIHLSYAPGGYRAVQVREMARRVTPAHLHIAVDNAGEQFLVGGPSQIGLDKL